MNALATRLRPVTAIVYAAAAALLLVGVWYALFAEHITVSDPPDGPPAEFYQWFATTLPQERLLDAAAIAGVAGLVLAVAVVRDRLTATDDRPGVRYGAATAMTGGLVWIIDTTFVIGGHHAVGLMATHGNPIDAVNEINFTVDTIDHAFSILAYLLLACGLVAMAGPIRALDRTAGALTYAAAAGSVLAALGFVLDSDSLTLWAQGLTAALLLPAWLLRSARLHPATTSPPHVTATTSA